MEVLEGVLVDIGPAASRRHPKKAVKNEARLSKAAYLVDLPRAVARRIAAVYETGTGLGHVEAIPRDSCPNGSDRRGHYPDWTYRLLEASFAVEDELEHAAVSAGGTRAQPGVRRRLEVVDELRRRRNAWLDILGENEALP